MSDLAWETIGTRIAYRCEGFDVITDEVRLPDGTETTFDYVTEAPSVVVLPVTPAGDVVVIDEWRQAVGRENRGLPAGNVEDGESTERAARRELAEETGYEAGDLTHLTTVEPANGFADAVYTYYVARECEPTAEQSLDHNESISVTTTSVDELVEAARNGDLRDGRTAMGVCYYALFEHTEA